MTDTPRPPGLDELFRKLHPRSDTPPDERAWLAGILFGRASRIEEENAVLRAEVARLCDELDRRDELDRLERDRLERDKRENG
jgi:hypothetical protein